MTPSGAQTSLLPVETTAQRETGSRVFITDGCLLPNSSLQMVLSVPDAPPVLPEKECADHSRYPRRGRL